MRTSLPALLLATLAMTACNPCAERCRVESRTIDDCLGDWGLQWADFEAEGAREFRDVCVAREKVWIESLDGSDQAAEIDACLSLTGELRGSGSCEEIWEALVGYGAG